MKAKVKKTSSNWVHSGEAISVDDFKKVVSKAEKGPFYSVNDEKKILRRGRQCLYMTR